MKENIITISIIIIIVSLCSIIIKNTFAIEETKLYQNTQVIENNTNGEILYNNIYNFISRNDDILISLATYEESIILNENYDFLLNFAINYIIDNKEYYKEKIVNKQINKEEIYKITNNIFGVSYFYINDKKEIKLEKDERRFNLKIEKIDYEKKEDTLYVNVKYDNIAYKYTLEEKKDRYIIKNIEVL